MDNIEPPAPADQTLRLQAFTTFFEAWQLRQESFLEQLVALISETSAPGSDHYKMELEEKCMILVQQVLAHYREYYEEKLKAANDDVFLVFSAPWFTPSERTLFWVSGFKPSLIFQLVIRVVDDISAVQEERIEFVRGEIKNKEIEIGEAMARVQESVAAPQVMALVRREGRLVNGEVSEQEAVMEELKGSMLVVMRRADGIRGTAAREVLDVLSPMQKVKLLAGKAQFWVRARRFGLQRDSDHHLQGETS